MILLDTNIILRYLLKDNEQYEKAVDIIDNHNVFITNEVIIEASYVLQKVYKVPRDVISNIIERFYIIRNCFLQK